jgi:hypothetical protein
MGTISIGEYYMVRNEIWEQAWVGRRKSWHGKMPATEILCIACLEARIGRLLTPADFTAVFPKCWPPVSRSIAKCGRSSLETK